MTFEQALNNMVHGYGTPHMDALNVIEEYVANRCETNTDGLMEWLGGGIGMYTGEETAESLAAEWDALNEND